jgi:hypothetical protein
MRTHYILGVHVTDRLRDAAVVQRLLTEYGTSIKTRLGLHDVEAGTPGPQGLVLLELVDSRACEALTNQLKGIAGVDVQQMVFDHPA